MATSDNAGRIAKQVATQVARQIAKRTNAAMW
jgi:hypothetical protein